MWVIDWDGVRFTEAELTVAHLNAICLVQGVDSWEQCNPLAGPARAVGVLAVVVSVATGRRVDEVIAEIAKRPASDLLYAFSVAEDEEAPVREVPYPPGAEPVRKRPASKR